MITYEIIAKIWIGLSFGVLIATSNFGWKTKWIFSILWLVSIVIVTK